MRPAGFLSLAASLLVFVGASAQAEEVRVKDLGRFLGWRDNALVGYGIVTGLSGSGDSSRSAVTRQTLGNVLSNLGINITPEQLQSRNVAAVIVTSTLPPASNVGDHIDATVTSIGDARSLAGGTLLMTPLVGPDRKSYALAQGPLVVGGYNFQDNLNLRQKNYPTSGQIPGGATVEAPVNAALVSRDGDLTFILKDPDFTTAERIAQGLNLMLGDGRARVRGADAVLIRTDGPESALNALVARIENVAVQPDLSARVVINERSGTVVAGGNVHISSVVVAQGDIKVAISVDRQASQPYLYGGYAPDVRSLVVTNTKLEVEENHNDTVIRLPNTTVADLVQALSRAKVSTRNMIAIMQAIKAAGALHANIIVQ
ncbi:MAG TPA: flagellar basal body P-ring protein FlgI [Novosphingobium sp.]